MTDGELLYHMPAARSGEQRGSVAHLHVHFVTLDHVPARPVRFRVSGVDVGSARTPGAFL